MPEKLVGQIPENFNFRESIVLPTNLNSPNLNSLFLREKTVRGQTDGKKPGYLGEKKRTWAKKILGNFMGQKFLELVTHGLTHEK